MQITFIGHASILIETKGLRIISDPWWLGSCFGAQWWIYPPPSRYGSNSPVMYWLKQRVKIMLGQKRSDLDLYDLKTWTVWQQPSERT